MGCKLFVLLLVLLPLTSAEQHSHHDPVSFKTGNFVVHIDLDNLPTVIVTQNRVTKPFWTSPKNSTNFVAAAKINDTVLQNGGNYVFPNATPEAFCAGVVSKYYFDSPIVRLTGNLCNKGDFYVIFEGIDDNQLGFSVSMDDNGQYNQIRLSYSCENDEQFYGFGVQYSIFNMKGRRLPVFLSEQGVGRGLEPFSTTLDAISPRAGGAWYTTYTYVPQYITSHSNCLMLTTLNYTVFDLTVNDTVTIELTGIAIEGRLITGKSILDVLTTYTTIAGRLKPLPKWLGVGAILGLQGGTDYVRQTLVQVEVEWGHLNDVVGIWLQDWTGQRVFSGPNDLPRTGLWWNWEVDETLYPNWKELIADLRFQDMRVLTYINPLFSNVTQRGTPFNHNYLEEGLKNNYFIKLPNGSVWRGYGNSCMADLSQSTVTEWLVDMIIQNMLKRGVCGWMCDFGESVPLEFQPGEPNPGPSYHSLYPTMWADVNTRAIKQAKEMLDSNETLCDSYDITFFMRSGNIFSPKSSLGFWLGDQMVLWDSFEGLGTAVIGMLTGGFSGFSATHSDIGGYTAIDRAPFKYVRTKELFIRWCELAAFTTMYRSHLGTLPKENWQFNSDKETLQHFFRMSVVFQCWNFYRQELIVEAADKGWPVARHMILVYPDNPKVFAMSEELKYQFMLGTELLMAPVLQAFDTTGLVPFVRVFLPAGTAWVHVWTNTVYYGADQFVAIGTPQGKPCVLYVSGSQVGKQFVQNLKDRDIL